MPDLKNDPSTKQLMAAWSKIITTVEETAAPHSKKSFLNKKGFLSTFKRVLNEVSGEYPFLHCIQGHFNYKDGKASFGGTMDERLNEGLGKALSVTVSRLHAEKPEVNIKILVKDALQPVIRSNADVIKHFSLGTFCDLFKMTTYEKVLKITTPVFGSNTEQFLERQCLNKIGVTSENFKSKHIVALIEQIEKSATLVISKNEVEQLCQDIESIGVRS